jgi:arsenate reductase
MGITRVLFVCIGNSCRSQMAEAFARAYGSDCIVASSAGLRPASMIAPDTMRAMAEKHIDIAEHFPKSLKYLERAEFDLVVNMSGKVLPTTFGNAKLVEWYVQDPIGMEYDEHCQVRNQIARLVMELILELRRPPEKKLRGLGSNRPSY